MVFLVKNQEELKEDMKRFPLHRNLLLYMSKELLLGAISVVVNYMYLRRFVKLL
jgi:hypothetical protein